MRVHLDTLCAGPGGVIQPGLRDLDDDLARQLISAGYAREVTPQRRVTAETAEAPEPEGVETARVNVAKRKRRKR